MSQFERTHLEIVAEGIRLFNAQKYWDEHPDELAPAIKDMLNLVRFRIIQKNAGGVHRQSHLRRSSCRPPTNTHAVCNGESEPIGN